MLDALSHVMRTQYEMLDALSLSTPIKPSIKEPSNLDLKPLPNHLRYAYLGNSSTLPISISFGLTNVQGDKLLRVLREHKKAL